MPSDPSQALEPFRSYLEVLARVHLDPRLRGKLDPADVVQQALLRAYATWPDLKARDRPVLLAWLRSILARTLADVLKHLRGWTLKRIGDHLGRTVPAVASLLRRGLEDLRRRLSAKE